MDSELIIKQLKAIQETKNYIKNLPFEDYTMERLIKYTNQELDYVEYSIAKKIGEHEIEKIKKTIN